MKKVLFTILITTLLAACGSKAYNTELKQIQLGMTKEQVVTIMGEDYTTSGVRESWGKTYETIEYRGRYKFTWIFNFEDNRLVKWYKETEDGK